MDQISVVGIILILIMIMFPIYLLFIKSNKLRDLVIMKFCLLYYLPIYWNSYLRCQVYKDVYPPTIFHPYYAPLERSLVTIYLTIHVYKAGVLWPNRLPSLQSVPCKVVLDVSDGQRHIFDKGTCCILCILSYWMISYLDRNKSISLTWVGQ